MSLTDSTIDLESWSKSLGFPGVQDKEFQDNWKKFVCPAFRYEWRLLKSHIRPRDEVTHIRKQLLLYKLTKSGSLPLEKMKKFNTCNEMDHYKNCQKLESKIATLNYQINYTTQEVEEMHSKLEKRVQNEEDDRQLLKQMKRNNKEILNDHSKVKMANFLLETMSSRSLKPFQDKTPWMIEVEGTLKLLAPGKGVEAMMQGLSDLNRVTPYTTTTKDDSHNLLFAMSEECNNRVLKLGQLGQTLSEKEAQLASKMAEFVRFSTDKCEMELDKFFLDTKLQLIRKNAQGKAIEEILKELQEPNQVDLNYTIAKETMGKILSEIKTNLSDAHLYYNVKIDWLSENWQNLKTLIKNTSLDVPNLHLVRALQDSIQILKNTYGNEHILNGDSSKVDQVKWDDLIKSIEDLKSLLTISNPQLDLHWDSEIVKKMKNQEQEKGAEIDKLTIATMIRMESLKGLMNKNSTSLNFWTNPPCADCLPGHPDFKDLRKRYLKAVSKKNGSDTSYL